jgi:hypothetical protein
MSTPDYRAFARDMMKLCKKHGIKIRAHNEGLVLLGPVTATTIGDSPYSVFRFSPTEAVIGDDGENPIKMAKED